MRILFVYSVAEVNTHSVRKLLTNLDDIAFGISYISSMLKSEGHNVELAVLSSNEPKKSLSLLKKKFNDYNPQVVGLTAVASQYDFIKSMAFFIKQTYPQTFIVIGGVHATLNPTEVAAGPFDCVCIGEGEHPMRELCASLQKGIHPVRGIANLWIKQNDGSFEKIPPRPFNHDLDSLPFPDMGMWEPWVAIDKGQTTIPVLIGRGCPYNCTYCCNHALKRVASGKYVRMRSPENIIKQITHIHEHEFPHCQSLFLEVEAIALDKDWAFELCRQIEAYNSTLGNTISYGCNFRISPQSVDEDLFRAMNKANIKFINIGLESGSERVRQEVLKRNYSNQKFLKVVSLARKYSMKVNVFNMIGIPGETVHDHMDTVRLNRKCQPNKHFTGIFFPYPGTQLYDICIQQGLIKNRLSIKLERLQAVIDLPGFSKRQIQNAYTWFNYRVYKGYKPYWQLLLQVVINKMRCSPVTNDLFHGLSSALHRQPFQGRKFIHNILPK